MAMNARSFAPLAIALALAAAAMLPACDTGEGTLFTITPYPASQAGEDPLVVFQTKSTGYDDTNNSSFPVYVEIHGTHAKEYLPMGVASKGVEFRMYTFTGPAFPQETVELRSQQRSTVVLADAFSVQVGRQDFPDPAAGVDKPANYLVTGCGAIDLQKVSGNDLVDVKVGTIVVQLNRDQLQGIASYLARICTQRTGD